MFLATQYAWGALVMMLTVPAVTWTCTGVTAYAAARRKTEWAWLVPAHLPIFISIPLTFSALDRGLDRMDGFTVWTFLLPGAIALVAVALFVIRRKTSNRLPHAVHSHRQPAPEGDAPSSLTSDARKG